MLLCLYVVNVTVSFAQERWCPTQYFMQRITACSLHRPSSTSTSPVLFSLQETAQVRPLYVLRGLVRLARREEHHELGLTVWRQSSVGVDDCFFEALVVVEGTAFES